MADHALSPGVLAAIDRIASQPLSLTDEELRVLEKHSPKSRQSSWKDDREVMVALTLIGLGLLEWGPYRNPDGSDMPGPERVIRLASAGEDELRLRGLL